MNDLAEALESAKIDVAEAAPDFMPDVCAVEQDTGSQDTDGGVKSNWTTLHASIPCQEDMGAGSEMLRLGKVLAIGESVWRMPAVLPDGSLNLIAGKHRLTVAARGSLLQRTFYVTNVSPYHELFVRVTAKAEG